MRKPPALEAIGLARISGPEQYRLSFNRPIVPLLKSIREVGQTAPVLCRETKSGIELFSGYRRREAMKALGKRHILALVWRESALSQEQAFRIAFFENALTRGLNIIEQAMAAQKLRQLGVGAKKVAVSYFQKAGLPASVATVEALAALAGLESGWKIFLAEKQFGLRHASGLSRLTAPDRKALEFLLTLGATASQFREVLEMADEIGKKDQSGFEQIFKAPELCAVLNDIKYVPAQKLDLAIKALKKTRYPDWERLKSRHQALLRKLRIPAEVKIEPADFFEGPEYKLELAVRKSLPAREIFQKLLSGAQSPDWGKLFETDDD